MSVLYFNTRISSGLMVQSLYFLIERLLPFPIGPLEAVFFHATVLSMIFLLFHATLFSVMLYALQRQLRSYLR